MNKLVLSQFNSSLIHNLQQYQAKEKFCDTTVVCEEKYFQLHRVILANCSDYFEDIFSKTPCKHPFIVLKDITPKEFKLIINFIYKGEVEICQNQLNKFLDIARGLKIKGINTATVLINENGETDKMCDKLHYNDPDIIEVEKHTKSFKKKKRKLDGESITCLSDEEEDIQLEFIHTKTRNKKKIKHEKPVESSEQDSSEVAGQKGKNTFDIKTEPKEFCDVINIKEENLSLDSAFDPQASGENNTEDYLHSFEKNFEESECDVVEPVSEDILSEATFSQSNGKLNPDGENMNLTYSSELPDECHTLFASKRDAKKKFRDKRTKRSPSQDLKSELFLFEMSSSPNKCHNFRYN